MAVPPSVSEGLRMVVLGYPGVGKSATGNVLLGREAFRETETTECEIQSGTVASRNISVIDTPGINNKTLCADQLRRIISLSSPGPHVFLLVIRVGAFTEEQRNAVQWILENFGEQALRFTMVLLTGREDMTKRQLTNFSKEVEMNEFINKCGFGYCVINSKRELNPAQIVKLLEKIETMVQQKRDQCYTYEMYEEVQKQRVLQEGAEEEKKKGDKERTGGQVPQTEQIHDENIKREVIQTDMNTEEEVHVDLAITGKEVSQSPSTENPEDMERRQNVDMTYQNDTTRTEGEKKELQQEQQAAETLQEGLVQMDDKSIERDYGRQDSGGSKQQEDLRGATGGMIPNPVSDLRIVLLGMTRAGKSASGNTILGREAFGKNFPNSITNRQDGMVGNRTTTVIDTRGILPSTSALSFIKLLKECISLSTPGPHVFLLVISSPRTINYAIYPLLKNLGEEFLQRALVLLTHGDVWGRDHRRPLNQNLELKQLVNRCGGAFHIFNNKQASHYQVMKLLEKMEEIMARNGGKPYTQEMFKEAWSKKVLTEMNKRVDVLEKKVDNLSLKNDQLSTVIRQPQENKSEQDGCCLL